MTHEIAKKQRAAEILQQFPGAPKELAERCAWAEIRLAEKLIEEDKARNEKAAKN